jgi:hypothetical protein
LCELKQKPFILQEDERETSAVPPQFADHSARLPGPSSGFGCNGLTVPVYFPGLDFFGILVKGLRLPFAAEAFSHDLLLYQLFCYLLLLT